ncbi:MAG: DUF433 domain-containing protein [Bryobacterales bacterium]|nr:DUF433 domain-containing protein [Bryobacterales bacterium]
MGGTIAVCNQSSEAYCYIVRSAGVRGGKPIVEDTRIAVHDVIGLPRNGETIDSLRRTAFLN